MISDIETAIVEAINESNRLLCLRLEEPDYIPPPSPRFRDITDWFEPGLRDSHPDLIVIASIEPETGLIDNARIAGINCKVLPDPQIASEQRLQHDNLVLRYSEPGRWNSLRCEPYINGNVGSSAPIAEDLLKSSAFILISPAPVKETFTLLKSSVFFRTLLLVPKTKSSTHSPRSPREQLTIQSCILMLTHWPTPSVFLIEAWFTVLRTRSCILLITDSSKTLKSQIREPIQQLIFYPSNAAKREDKCT